MDSNSVLEQYAAVMAQHDELVREAHAAAFQACSNLNAHVIRTRRPPSTAAMEAIAFVQATDLIARIDSRVPLDGGQARALVCAFLAAMLGAVAGAGAMVAASAIPVAADTGGGPTA